jgi:hypothetical protein
MGEGRELWVDIEQKQENFTLERVRRMKPRIGAVRNTKTGIIDLG